ncbi:MAG: LytS/YhcK type 5TM receptor domain-containing protein [Paracoccaceae bacterium]
MVYGAPLRSLPSARLREVLLGAAFGLAGMLVMLSPVDFAPGMPIDPRALMVALPAAFGGLRAGVIAWVVVVTTRLSMGWPADNPGQEVSLRCSASPRIWSAGWPGAGSCATGLPGSRARWWR